ncbi:stage V sporulation protein AB [Hazenella sp. IB182357]|uniref:Stage V sporulation protein AB n=1 Tax=Polycladospora coralii TaxID=2771432 RepID=A0A926NGL2_9BACL|nr:stage V sporulation protein AB [Polycladospora coralii]MBD1372963.1 stage V sporulation protein AB [Polycladospora coralii]MBS7530980.1 stage V sporulation protein AB [Polycladospora coralii]
MINLYDGFLIIIGLASGFVVGSGFVAFITVLDIVPRLAQITRTYHSIRSYEYGISLGVLVFTWLDFFNVVLGFPILMTSFIGASMGIFVGMLAAALTEVVNVIPITVKRLHMQRYLTYLLMAMALGKVVGSLFEWLIYL